jgi:hypothetical protein
MRNKDTIALSEAYTLIQEKNFKSAVAAAAMGLSSLHGQGLTADDLADRANPHEPEVAQPAQQNDGETSYHKALVAFQKAVKLKVVDNLTLSQIALDKDIAKRYALFLVQHGQRIPDIIRKATSKYTSDLESAFSSDVKN